MTEMSFVLTTHFPLREFFSPDFQDGKALPDGPIVISPDGVFPSLFREGNWDPLALFS